MSRSRIMTAQGTGTLIGMLTSWAKQTLVAGYPSPPVWITFAPFVAHLIILLCLLLVVS